MVLARDVLDVFTVCLLDGQRLNLVWVREVFVPFSELLSPPVGRIQDDLGVLIRV